MNLLEKLHLRLGHPNFPSPSEALRESEERFKSAFDCAAIGMALVAPDGRWLQVNRSLCELTGYPEEVLLLLTFQDITHPEDLDADLGLAKKLFAGELSSYQMEKRYLRKDGRTIWVLLTCSVVHDDQGQVLHAIAQVQDISDRKKNVAVHLGAKSSENRFRSLIENSFDGIALLNAEGFITYVSPSASRIMGYYPEEFIGKHFSDLAHPNDLPEHVQRHQEVISQPGKSITSCNLYRHKEGTWRWLEIQSTNLLSEPGVEAKVVNFRDVSDRRKMEEQLRQSQKMEAIGILAGGVAHDFNNLLTIIQGYGDILLGALPADDPQREYVEEILKAGDRSAALTRQLLAFSRKQVVAPRILDLNEVILDTEKMLRRVIGEDVELVTVLQPGLDTIKADPGQMEQVLLNLAVNARDAMPRGGKLTIETKVVELDPSYVQIRPDTRPGPYVMVAVSDSGMGMTEEVKHHIFEPFFTTKGVGKGTGLGLAVVHGIVKQAEGHIEVYSEPGLGTSIKLLLPSMHQTAPGKKGGANLAKAPNGTETILLVEDDGALRVMTQRVLANCGYALLHAGGGDEAIKVCLEHPGPIHLLVTDVVMPGIGGGVLAERLLSIHPEMKVLYLSGYTDDAIFRHGILQEKVNFLQKPFSPLVLAHRVREALDQE